MTTSDPILRCTADSLPTDFVFKVAQSDAEIDGFWRLRHAIFCEEQAIFHGNDVDEHESTMIPIVCLSLIMGMPDRVVGVVRIDEREPGLWWGSRLGVHRDYRHIDRMSAGVAQRSRQPPFWPGRSVGAGLVFKAVSLAHALGCETFFAHVQKQNEAFFRQLYWEPLEEVELYGLPHVKMRADLARYAAADASELEYRRALAS